MCELWLNPQKPMLLLFDYLSYCNYYHLNRIRERQKHMWLQNGKSPTMYGLLSQLHMEEGI
jgi:hypothetical protein